MAIVKNVDKQQRPIPLSSGRSLGFGETENVDPAAPNEAVWIGLGSLIVVDGSQAPPVPAAILTTFKGLYGPWNAELSYAEGGVVSKGGSAYLSIQPSVNKNPESHPEYWVDLFDASLLPQDASPETPSLRSLGTGANQAAAGNDSRLSNARTPTAHAGTHATGQSDAVSPASIGAEAIAHKGQPNGYPGLNGEGLIDGAVLPPLALTDVHVVANQAAMLAISGAHEGTVAVREDRENQAFIHNTGTTGTVSDWTALGFAVTVTTVNGHEGAVTLTAADVAAIATSQKGAHEGVGTLDSAGHQPLNESPLPLLHSSGISVNVTTTPYNCTPGLPGDQSTKLQAAINAVHSAGGGEVYLPASSSGGSVYEVDLNPITGATSIAAGVFTYPNVRIRCDEGATIKLIAGATLPEGCVQAHVVSNANPYTHELSKASENMHVDGLTIDCNAAAQSSGVAAHGLFRGAARNCWVTRTKVKNLYGTSTGPPGETMHFEANHCQGITYIACETDGSGSAQTASGFSTDNSVDVTWVDCVGHGMGHNAGFTGWQSAHLHYIGCRSFSNAGPGFNLERCQHVSYTNTHSGGRSPWIGDGSSANPFFESVAERHTQQLANATGFAIEGCAHVTFDSTCLSTYNTGHGVTIGIDTPFLGFTLKGTVESGSKLIKGLEGTTGTPVVGMYVFDTQSFFPGGSVVERVISSTEVEVSLAATGTQASEHSITFDWNPHGEGTLTNGSTTVSGLSAALVAELMPGMSVGDHLNVAGHTGGLHVPNNTVITKILSTTEISISNKASATETTWLHFDGFRSCWDVRVGGTHRLNGLENVYFNETEAIQVDCVSVANSDDTTSDAIEMQARAPYLYVIDRTAASGLRLVIRNEGADGLSPTKQLTRILNAATSHTPVEINGADQLVTTGRALALRLIADANAVLTSQDDRVAWSTLTAARTGTLPELSKVAKGTEFELSDESGNASATKTITAVPAGTDTISGATAINTPNSRLLLRSTGTKWIGYGVATSGAPTIAVTSTEDLTVPSWATHAQIVGVSGGAGGGGGGSAKTSAAVTKHVGGSGGGSALPASGLFPVTPGETLHCVLGAGTAGGAGGAANEHAGASGTAASEGTVTHTSGAAVLICATPVAGAGGAANSETSLARSPSAQNAGTSTPGSSGEGRASNGQYGILGGPYQAPGGDGGFPASATEGGKGGKNSGKASVQTAFANQTPGNSYTGATAGGEGVNGTLPGEGGAGGGGGAPGGAGGNGGSGANGQLWVTWLP